jgi:sugar phosphate isomerase/epimerase
MTRSRREFVQWMSTAAIGTAFFSRSTELLHAYPLGLPPGLQLWSVREELAKNRDATLRRIAQIGYREVELFELPKSPAEFRRKCADVGLTPVSSHFYLDSLKSQKTIDAAKELGLEYIIVVFPTLRAMSDRDISNMSVGELNPLYERISLDDYKWNAEQFNKYGAIMKRNGLQLGYHNHAVDLKKFGGVVGLNSLIESTDPNLVVFEMDCGHVIHAGYDPIAYLKKYPSRIRLLHLKDLKPGYTVSTSLDTEEKDTDAEIGSGVIDWKHLFEVAKHGNVKHCFVEHEGKMDHPPLEAIEISYKYLQQF